MSETASYQAVLDAIRRLELAEARHVAANVALDAAVQAVEHARAEYAEANARLIARAPDLLAENEALKARIAELEAENAELKTPDCWTYHCTMQTPEEVMKDAGDDKNYHLVFELDGYTYQGICWAAFLCTGVDEDGQLQWRPCILDTKDDALRCWPESLAAAQAAAKGGGDE